LSDVIGLLIIAGIVAGVMAILFLSFLEEKARLQLVLLSIHHALVGIGSLLLTYVIEGSDM
jgi:hypothetical protein